MIGDSGIDLMAAKAASVPMVMVSFGYAGQAVPGATPEVVIDHFDELHASLISLCAKRCGIPLRRATRLNPAKYQS